MPNHTEFPEFARYKFRAEMESDARLFLMAIDSYLLEAKIHPCYVPVKEGKHTWSRSMPDVDVEFTASSELSLGVMRWLASALIDCHVIAETLQLEADYDGERLYSELKPLCEEPASQQLQSFQNGLRIHADALMALYTGTHRQLYAIAKWTQAAKSRS